MNKLTLILILSLSFLTSCFYPKKGRVLPQCRMYWNDTLRYKGEERKLLKTYFDLVLAFENKDTSKVKSMCADTIDCAECHMIDTTKINGEHKRLFSLNEYMKIGWNHYLYWPKTGAAPFIKKDTTNSYEVWVSNNSCRHQECSTTIIEFNKIENRFIYKGYYTMP